MNGFKEGHPMLPESKVRLALAWLSWLFMLVGSGLAVVYLLILLAFLAVGGVELVSGVWAGHVKNDPLYTRIILASLFIGLPPGAILGVRLWSKLMRRTGWISADRIKRMSGF